MRVILPFPWPVIRSISHGSGKSLTSVPRTGAGRRRRKQCAECAKKLESFPHANLWLSSSSSSSQTHVAFMFSKWSLCCLSYTQCWCCCLKHTCLLYWTFYSKERLTRAASLKLSQTVCELNPLLPCDQFQNIICYICCLCPSLNITLWNLGAKWANVEKKDKQLHLTLTCVFHVHLAFKWLGYFQQHLKAVGEEGISSPVVIMPYEKRYVSETQWLHSTLFNYWNVSVYTHTVGYYTNTHKQVWKIQHKSLKSIWKHIKIEHES